MECTRYTTDTTAAFITKAVEHLTVLIAAAITDRGECFIGLSGGSTPLPVYEALIKNTTIDWSKVFFFLVDERYVPVTDPNSNQSAIRQILHKNEHISDDHCIFPDTSLPLLPCIALYTKQLTALFAQHAPDIIILGMGHDGHIASLFPPVPEIAFGEVLVVQTETTTFAVKERISISPLVILSALQTVLLLQGADKHKTLNECLAAQLDPIRWPLHIPLSNGRMTVVEQGAVRG